MTIKEKVKARDGKRAASIVRAYEEFKVRVRMATWVEPEVDWNARVNSLIQYVEGDSMERIVGRATIVVKG